MPMLFIKMKQKVSEWKETDMTEMKPGIHERKWEIDSLVLSNTAGLSLLETHR